MDDSQILKSIDKKLSALIALSALSLVGGEEKANTKIEVLLNSAGLDNAEIAKITGKKLAAVQKAVQRAKK